MTGADTQVLRTVGLVVRREFLAQVGAKAYRWSLLLMSLAVVVAAVVYSALADDGPERIDVAVVGAGTALAEHLPEIARTAGLDMHVQDDVDEERAQFGLQSGAFDVAVGPTGDRTYSVVVGRSLDPELAAVLSEAIRAEVVNEVLADYSVDSDAALAEIADIAITVVALDPPDPQESERMSMAWVALLLLFTTVLTFGVYVAIGVVEEKSTRVAELLLATIRPIHLMWGKVLGIGASALLQVAVIGAAGLVAGRVVGLITLTGTAVSVFAATLVWALLGYLLFSLMYAAAGSLVSRQEEVQGVTTPLMLLVIFSYLISIAAVGSPDGTIARVAGWVPPVSAFVMPVRTASGEVEIWEMAGSALVMLLACALVAWVAARVYTRSILHTGSRLSWRAALTR
ncbi:ABC transporter permease [Nocardia shimofusensis]|uniref:ABC transporter permease n=1 Tax=Nocardia shimofusensis TaxID=228596 RepID=UPI000833E9E3|nr:ABC transporter permease [Nocardia shimofusensis]